MTPNMQEEGVIDAPSVKILDKGFRIEQDRNMFLELRLRSVCQMERV